MQRVGEGTGGFGDHTHVVLFGELPVSYRSSTAKYDGGIQNARSLVKFPSICALWKLVVGARSNMYTLQELSKKSETLQLCQMLTWQPLFV
jgi:hypothetical protein